MCAQAGTVASVLASEIEGEVELRCVQRSRRRERPLVDTWWRYPTFHCWGRLHTGGDSGGSIDERAVVDAPFVWVPGYETLKQAGEPPPGFGGLEPRPRILEQL